MDLQDVFTVFRVNLNWNPTYSHAEIPAGMTDVPPYWKVMTQHVPPALGRCRLSDVRIRDIKAIGAKTAFEVAAFPDLPLERFRIRDPGPRRPGRRPHRQRQGLDVQPQPDRHPGRQGFRGRGVRRDGALTIVVIPGEA
ncbi:hypothetical protein ACRAWD_29540 [Caulobacter segnis]